MHKRRKIGAGVRVIPICTEARKVSKHGVFIKYSDFNSKMNEAYEKMEEVQHCVREGLLEAGCGNSQLAAREKV